MKRLKGTKRCCMEAKFNNRKPKVMLHIIMPNQISGPNNAAKLISNSFLKENYEFAFLTQEFHSGGKISVKLIFSLIKQIKTFKPDVIHLSGLLGSGFHAVVAARLCGIKNILLTLRGSSTDAINISKVNRFVFGHIIEPITMHLSKKVYAVCNAMANRDYIQKHTKGRLLETIHNSAPTIDIKSILPFSLREKLEIDSESLIVVVVGRIIYDKGVTYIADAIKNIVDERIKFVFVGDEPREINLPYTLKNEIEERRVFFLGAQKNVISIINECDIFLFATLHENLSNALLEACAVGLAVVATNVGGNPEVIQHNENGILIPTANSERIKEAIIYLANNKEVRDKLGKQAIKTVETRFSQDFLLKKLENVYNTMLNK